MNVFRSEFTRSEVLLLESPQFGVLIYPLPLRFWTFIIQKKNKKIKTAENYVYVAVKNL